MIVVVINFIFSKKITVQEKTNDVVMLEMLFNKPAHW